MAATPLRTRRFSSVMGDEAVRFGDRILIAPTLGEEASRSMSAYRRSSSRGTCRPAGSLSRRTAAPAWSSPRLT